MPCKNVTLIDGLENLNRFSGFRTYIKTEKVCAFILILKIKKHILHGKYF